MKKSTLFLMAVVLLSTVACANMMSSVTKDIQVQTEVDPKANMSGYETYAWLGSAQILYDPVGRWEPRQIDMDAEIRHLIDRELRKKGITEVASNPDMVVLFAAGVNMAALEIKEDPDTKLQVLENVPEGALLVTLIDAQTTVPVWAGIAEAEVLEDPSTEDVRKRLDYAVSKMFKKLPR